MNWVLDNKKKLAIAGASIAIATAFASAGLPIPSDAFKPVVAVVYCWIWDCN